MRDKERIKGDATFSRNLSCICYVTSCTDAWRCEYCGGFMLREANVVHPLPPRVINFKFPLQPRQKYQKYSITQYEELGFS